jgi:predicted transcriptional regulator
MKATTVRINDDMLWRIDGLAAALHRSRSWVINQALDRFLDHEELSSLE